MTCWFWFIFVVVTIIFRIDAKPTPTRPPKLLVVSYDAFRYDYFDRKVTPFMNELRMKGIFADHMRNVFVTKTFPNHHTISTGMYVENHGVIDSEYLDVKSNKTVKYSYDLYHYNNGILPIWTLNELNGGERRSGVMMWPGSAFEYHKKNATFRVPFNTTVPWKSRVDEVISWFKHAAEPINFGMMYIEEPDFHGHGIGINGARFDEVLLKLDEITYYLHEKLRENNMTDVNVIHLSDHGMATVTIDRIVNLTNYIDPKDYTTSGLSPVIHIYPRPGKKSEIYKNLQKASYDTNKFDVYLKENIPEHFHFKNNTRIGPILAVARVGNSFETLYDSFSWYEKEFNITINEKSEFGVHGYDNTQKEMWPFFFGVGPAFLPQCEVPAFDNVDLLPLFCEILEIECLEVNGQLGELRKCLAKHQYEAILYKGIYIGGIIVSILGILALFLVYLKRKRAERHNAKYRVSDKRAS
ncbi:hypothetical protein TKK_0009211 [Trichogramma kaykai]